MSETVVKIIESMDQARLPTDPILVVRIARSCMLVIRKKWWDIVTRNEK